MADDAASVVNSLYSRADTICGPEHVEHAARRVTNGHGFIAVSEGAASGAHADEHVHARRKIEIRRSQDSRTACLEVGQGPCVPREEHSDMQDAHNSFLVAQSDLLLSYDEKLGEGSTGTVYRGIVCNDIEVAVKIIHASMNGTERQQAIADLRQVFLPTPKP